MQTKKFNVNAEHTIAIFDIENNLVAVINEEYGKLFAVESNGYQILVDGEKDEK